MTDICNTLLNKNYFMKKTHLTISFAIVIIWFASFAMESCQNSTSVQTNSSSSNNTLNIAYVKLDTLVEAYHFFSDEKTALLAESQQKQSDLEARYRNLQRRAYEIQSQVQNRMMTPTKAQKKQEQLAKDEQKILADKQMYELEILEKNQDLMKKVLDSIKNYVAIYNKDHNFNLIMTNDTLGSTILYAEDQMDITDDILTGLNKRYLNSKKDNEEKDTEEKDTEKKNSK